MARWLSKCIEEKEEAGDALRDLSQKINHYKDAAKPSCCRDTKNKFLYAGIDWFRPDWEHFTLISAVCGILGVVVYYLVLNPSYDVKEWAKIALTVTVPVFVLGVSLATLARSMSKSGRFAVEYLNDSCRMVQFCCLTLIAVLAALVSRFLSSVGGFPRIVTIGFCAASLGAAIDCLAMLAFVVCETINCSVPSKSGVVLKYAARKMTWAYLKEAYVTRFRSLHRDYLEKWCTDHYKAIHPPSKYMHYFGANLHKDKGKYDYEIKLEKGVSGSDVYKDYEIEGLDELEKYLEKNNAELYLILPYFESEQHKIGIVHTQNAIHNEGLRNEIIKMGKKVVRCRKTEFKEEDGFFWGSHFRSVETSLEGVVHNGEPEQIKKIMEVPLKPLSVLRNIRGYKSLYKTGEDYRWRDYRFVGFYVIALKEMLKELKSSPDYGKERAGQLANELKGLIWDETKKIFEAMDYHSMELYTWLVPQMYKIIRDAGDEGRSLQDMRAKFGGFYDCADSWLEEKKAENTDDVDKMRLVLYEGFTKWLLIAIKEKDNELIEQLCDAGRSIVFGSEGVKFEHREVVDQHFVLTGHLIGMAKTKEVKAEAVERLFCEKYSNSPDVDFNDLVRFYLGESLPMGNMDTYLRLFSSYEIRETNVFTGSSHSSGSGTTGVHEMARAFVFLAAHAFEKIIEKPDAVAEMSGRIMDEDIQIVEDVFGKKMPKQWFDWLRN